MGIMKRLKQAAEIALEIDPPSQTIPPVAPGQNAWSAEQLAALEQESGGTAGRAIVQSSDGPPGWHGGEFGGPGSRTSVEMIIQLRLPDGSFGERSRQTPTLPREAAFLAGRGTDIPVLVDPATRTVTGIDVKQLVREQEPYFAEARQAEKDNRRRARDVGFLAGAIKEGIDDLRAPASPDDTIEGVAVHQWQAMRTALSKHPIPPDKIDALAQRYGVPPGRWQAVDEAWTARMEAEG
jgi:hypothetical protein